jgi:hypothetical protein
MPKAFDPMWVYGELVELPNRQVSEIKTYRQHNIQKIYTDFWSNNDPGKTHKGKTSEREFYYL